MLRHPSGFGKLVIVCAALSAVALSVALQSGVFFRTYRTPSSTMEPTIGLGDTIVMRPTKRVGRGDIVVFRYPRNPSTTFVKRVIAVGGDTVEIRDKKVFLNGRRLQESSVVYGDAQIYPKADFLPEPQASRDQFGPSRVPALR